MTIREPMPELCNHDDPSRCTAECEEKARKFDEWIVKQPGMADAFQEHRKKLVQRLRGDGDGSVRPDGMADRARPKSDDTRG